MAFPADRAQPYINALRALSGQPAWIVGNVVAGTSAEWDGPRSPAH